MLGKIHEAVAMPLVEMTPANFVGIVGAEAAKFTTRGEQAARAVIRRLLAPAGLVLVSGGCHLGGIDIWAEEEYAQLPDRAARPDPVIHLPRTHSWAQGYQPRDRLIARDSAVVHVIVVDRYILGFDGRRFEKADGSPLCYHCERRKRELHLMSVATHVKSGACWTAYEAEKIHKHAQWHIITQ